MQVLLVSGSPCPGGVAAAAARLGLVPVLPLGGSPGTHLRYCPAVAPAVQLGLCLYELPSEVMQCIMDLLPTFGDRARLCAACHVAGRLEWRSAAPLRLEEELSGLGLGDVGARAVAVALAAPQSTTLGELCLGSNRIGDKGARAIASALVAGPLLRRLSLRDNEIGDSGAWAIAAALAAPIMLEELDLWGNQLTDLGKQAILSVARCEVFLELDRVPRSPRTPALRTSSAFGSSPVSGKMRAVLFDWISQVHTGVNAPAALDGAPDPQDMLFRTFSHVDAYLSRKTVHRTDLQLMGVACTLAAAGLESSAANAEEDAAAGQEDAELATWLAFVTDGACTADEVREAAREVHRVLGFRLHQPTAYTFLRRYLRRTGWTEESFSLANYLIELAAIDAGFLDYRPQVVAAAAAVLSRQYLSQGISVRHIPCWKTKLLRCAHVDLEQELAPCTAAMARLHMAEHGRPNKFVNKKYEWARLHMVAKITPNPPSDAPFFVNYLSADRAL